MKICAIIVTYNHDNYVLNKSIDSIISQVETVYLYNNSSHKISPRNKLNIYGNGINIGIGEAQNILLKIAIDQGFDCALLSDQDTFYPKNYFGNVDLHFSNNPLAAVICPRWSNLNSKIKYSGFHIIKNGNLFYNTHPMNLMEISHSISSGMVIRLSFMDKIGYFNESLFIDWVDYEWCWRLNIKGFKIYGDSDKVIRHSLGDESVKLFCREFTKRSKIRNYYILRNAIYLIFHTPKSFYTSYLIKKTVHHFVFSFFCSDNKTIEFYYLMMAIKHGIEKKLGKINI